MKETQLGALETMTRERFAKFALNNTKTFEQHEFFRMNCVLLSGSLENARAFLEPRGVGIGAFSRMVNLPISTVRHYVRLGLVEPFVVDGKYCFTYWNPAQVASVRWWSELGATLEEIIARKRAARTGMPGLQLKDLIRFSNDYGQGVGGARVAFNKVERGYAQDVLIWAHADGQPLLVTPECNIDLARQATIQHLTNELLEEYRVALGKLEARKLEIEERVARGRDLEQKLSGTLEFVRFPA